MNDQMFKALMKRYDAAIEDALLKIDLINDQTLVIPEHVDITGEIDKLLLIVSENEDKVAALRKHYGEKKARVAL